MISFFDSAYVDSRPISEKSSVLESVCHYGGFRVCDSESFDVVKKKINLYLSSQEKRFEGLMLLKTVSEQCHVEIFQQNAPSWAQMVLKVLQHHGESSGSRKLAYKILKELVRFMLSSSRLKREASVSLLPAIIDTLLESSIDDEWIEQSAECLAACIKYFPGACGLKKDKIEEFLILLLDRWELKEFEPIAECFAYLPACGVDGNDRSSSYQKIWTDQFKQFINVLNAILNFLYDGVENGCGDLKICSAKQLPPVPEEQVSAVLKLVHRFKAFGLCLSKMLVATSSIRVAVPADALLRFLGRTLSASPSHMEQNLLIYSVLPSLYLTALTVLESFILSCDQHLISVCQLVSKFLTQAIKNNSLKTSSSKDSLNLVRCAAYQVLQLYTERYKLFTVAENHREFLVSVMIGDMKPSVSEVKLDKPSNSLLGHGIETSDIEKHPSSSRTSTEALKALKDFVAYGNLDLKNFEEIYTSVVNTLLEIQEKPLDLPVPYSDESYRLALYSLLQVLSNNLHSQNFTCLPTTISLVTNGLDDLSSVVRSKCQEILDATDALVNTVKERMPASPSVKETCEEELVINDGLIIDDQISNNAGIYPVPPHVMSNEHSIVNEPSASVEMVNGVSLVTPVRETPVSQTVDSNKSFHSELSGEPERQDNGEITVQAEGNNEPVFYTNSNAYSPSEPEVEDEEEMEVEEEEEEEFKGSYVNHNGFSSEDDCISEEDEEVSPSKRPSSSDVQNSGPSSKKVILNDTEDHSDADVSRMLQDFIPTSPDQS